MKPIAMLGLVLIFAGIADLFFSHLSWTETKPVAKIGPLEITAQENHAVRIFAAAGVISVLAGGGLVFAGKRAT